MPCEFCNNPALLSRTVYANDLVFAFVGNMPIVPGHLLICPVRHVSKIDDLSDNELLAIKELLVKLKSPLRNIFHAEGFNYAWNEGGVAGQSVDHLHIHLIPRKPGDTGIYRYEPRDFLYRPGTRATTPDEELIGVAKIVRVFLST